MSRRKPRRNVLALPERVWRDLFDDDTTDRRDAAMAWLDRQGIEPLDVLGARSQHRKDMPECPCPAHSDTGFERG